MFWQDATLYTDPTDAALSNTRHVRRGRRPTFDTSLCFHEKLIRCRCRRSLSAGWTSGADTPILLINREDRSGVPWSSLVLNACHAVTRNLFCGGDWGCDCRLPDKSSGAWFLSTSWSLISSGIHWKCYWCTANGGKQSWLLCLFSQPHSPGWQRTIKTAPVTLVTPWDLCKKTL